MTDVAPHPGDFVVQPTNTEEEVDLDEMPENKFRFGGARNSVQMMKVRLRGETLGRLAAGHALKAQSRQNSN